MRWRSEAETSKTKLETELGDRRETSVGEEIGAPESTWKRAVSAIGSGLTNEKRFRGAHFEKIWGFEGERQILSGNPGYFPDFECI